MNCIEILDGELEKAAKYAGHPAHIVMTHWFYDALMKEAEGRPGILDSFRTGGDAKYRGVPIVLVTEVSRFHPWQVVGQVLDEMRLFTLKTQGED